MDSFYSREELMDLGFCKVGENVLVSRKASIYGAKNMSIGSRVRIDDFCFLSGKITIGNNVHITAGAMLYGGPAGIIFEDFSGIATQGIIFADSDDYSGNSLTNPTTPAKYKSPIQQPVHVKRHVLIGSGTTILPGVTLGEGGAIGAMSLVKNDTKPWMIYAGIPAKPIKERSKNLLKLEAAYLAELEGEHLPTL